MAVLGKRKASEPDVSQDDANEIFRRHFEAQFAPIDAPQKKRAVGAAVGDKDRGGKKRSSQDDESVESEWGGLSDDEISDDDDDDDDKDGEEEDELPVVEVVDHSSSQTPKPVAMSKRDLKAFMSSRPPEQTTTPQPTNQPATSSSSSASTLPEDAPSLLAQDLELRRLLAESHLLASPSLSAGVEPKPFASGRVRNKATDLRIQALGSKTSILKQENMPMNIRKGMVAAAEAREAKRRREARENGIILERPATTGKKRRERNRDGGIDRPGMGRLRGAELRLNDSDVKRVEGARDAFGRRSGSGGRGGKRR